MQSLGPFLRRVVRPPLCRAPLPLGPEDGELAFQKNGVRVGMIPLGEYAEHALRMTKCAGRCCHVGAHKGMETDSTTSQMEL